MRWQRSLAGLCFPCALLVALPWAATTMAGEDGRLMQVGVAKVDITPDYPVLLAGYGGRPGESEGIDQRIWARALVVGGEQPVVLLAIDNCGVPAGVVARIAAGIREAHGIPSERLVVCSSHTHSAPTLTGYAIVVWGGRTTPAQEERVVKYTSELVDHAIQATGMALRARVPCHLAWGQGKVTFGANRRVIDDGSWGGFGFQVLGPVDHSFPVLVARDREGQTRAIWCNYACHCTTVGGRNMIGGDWVGSANVAIETSHPGAIALTTIGCGADIGPQPSGSWADAEQHGRTIASEVVRLLEGDLKPLTEQPTVRTKTVQLPFAELQPRAYWLERTGAFHTFHAQQQLARLERDGALATHLPYTIATWSWGAQLAQIFLPGEVVVDYAVRLKRELDWQRLWINGWSNDVPCYIASRRVLDEGGYEADFSMIYYNQPARFAPQVEDVIVAAVHDLLDATFESHPGDPEFPHQRHPLADGMESGPPPVPTPEQLAKMQQTIQQGFAELPADQREIWRQSFATEASVAESGFQKLLSQHVSGDVWYDFTGGRRLRPYIRQRKLGRTISWQSAPLPSATREERSTLLFMGGVGWISEPATEGFVLLINDRETVHFDVTLQPGRWHTDDKSVTLGYLPTWVSNVDSGGYFYVTLPSDQLHEDGSCNLGVRSLGEGSRRWFAVDLLTETPELQQFIQSSLEQATND